MLEFAQTSISVNGLNIVKDISFTAKKGEITVLLGQNGSGKSTLLRSLVGVGKIAGRILLEGRELSSFSPSERAQKLAFLPQLLPHTGMSVLELCELGRNPYVGTLGRLSERDREAIRNALEQTQMTSMRYRPVHTLSGGERQHAFLSMMLSQGGDLLVMDEPTAFMDAAAARGFLELCRTLKSLGKTQLLVLHDLSHAVNIADEIVIMEAGRLVFAGSRDTCLAQGAIEQVFDVRRLQDGKDIFFI